MIWIVLGVAVIVSFVIGFAFGALGTKLAAAEEKACGDRYAETMKRPVADSVVIFKTPESPK